MAVSQLSIAISPPLPAPVPVAPMPAASPPPAGIALLRGEEVPADDLLAVLARRGELTRRLLDHPRPTVRRAMARRWGSDLAELEKLPPDPRLIDRLGLAACQRHGVLPWRSTGAVTLIAAPHPEDFLRARPMLTACFGPVAPALAPAPAIEAALHRARGTMMDEAARTCVPLSESCRSWGGRRQGLLARLGLVVLALWLLLHPLSLAGALTGWAVLTLLFATLLKATAIFSVLRYRAPEAPPPAEPPPADLPVVSIMVALLHESGIAGRLVRRLDRLDYPRDRLDILLVVEEGDRVTRTALARTELPDWMRVVVVPDGPLRTKPRALNHALAACRGSIVGVYDAEDAPEPDQIRRIAARFAARGPEVVCLQGMLDFYNPCTNWLSRCFTMEYASWFRIILPGLERLGLAIPLGGTTLFFRRAALEALGGWDAFNVTEDADLGMRLARHGYRTELIATTTFEEANCRALPWIKQRSRWLKGYMMTYAVHMRRPRQLLRQLGWWKFAGFQVFFLTTLSQYVLAPVLWSFWAVPLGLPHPVIAAVPGWLYTLTFGIFLATEAILFAVTLVALRLTPNRINPLWVPVLHVYFPLGALASYKAAWELVTKPFWWDKTSHGHFDRPISD
ncbi:MAG: glycosyltransferase [Gemmobacter sp.]|jgi:cellulose synthase/poly-beta-1,6-N-acetylglucosamine synthase-like glycosyltransferase|nr:glycosyltransferase [Gemmobacter sp.]